MGVHHVGLQPADHARELPGGRKVHFAPGGEVDDLQAGGQPPAQFAIGARDDDDAMPPRGNPLRGQQDLLLAAPPRARGVDLERKH